MNPEMKTWYDSFYVDELLLLREQARKNKDWPLSDELRNYLDQKYIFVFDTKHGQDVHYCPDNFFRFKDKKIETAAMSNRQYIEYRIAQHIRANNNFDAWVYSINNRKKKD